MTPGAMKRWMTVTLEALAIELTVVGLAESPIVTEASHVSVWPLAMTTISLFALLDDPGVRANAVCVPASYHGEDALDEISDQLPVRCVVQVTAIYTLKIQRMSLRSRLASSN
jgi:hypothetical protein